MSKNTKDKVGASFVRKYVRTLERRRNAARDMIWYADGIEFDTLQNVIDHFGKYFPALRPHMTYLARKADQESANILAELAAIEAEARAKAKELDEKEPTVKELIAESEIDAGEPEDSLADSDLQEEHAVEEDAMVDLEYEGDNFTMGDQFDADGGDE